MSVPGHRLDRMFNPETVVVIGDKSPEYMWIRANLPFKERGGNLYSVQIDPKEIRGIEALGVTNLTSILDVPEPIDYAQVAVPRQVSTYVLKDLIAAGAHGAGFFTSGFAETGQEPGIGLQEQLTRMARDARFNLVGPNCLGIHVPTLGVRFSADTAVVPEGNIAFLSQSGTHGVMFCLAAATCALQPRACASFGNAVVLDVHHYLDYFMQDDATAVIAMYVEGIRDGLAFVRALKAACARKPVVIWKGGQTRAGARATMSHTASLATAQSLWEGLVRQCGAIPVNTLDETIDTVKLLLCERKPTGKAMALLAMTGGPSVSITDAFEKAGLTVPRLTERSYGELAQFFNIVGGSFQNPLDMGVTIRTNPKVLERILHIVDADPNVDATAMDLSAMFNVRMWKDSPAALEKSLDMFQAHVRRSTKPFFLIMQPTHEEGFLAEVRLKFGQRGITVFASFERAAAAAARVLEHTTRGQVLGK